MVNESTKCLTWDCIIGNVSYFNPNDTLMNCVGCGSVYSEYKQNLFHHRQPATIVIICLYGIIFLAALLGNLVSLFVLLNRHYSRCSTDYFLINMAFSDLLVAIVCIPVAVAQNVYRGWVFGQFMCKAVFYLQGVAVTASVWTISCLSMDRFIAIKHPMLARHIRSSLYIKIAVACVWLVSLSVLVPIAYVRDIFKMDIIPTDPVYFCNEYWISQTGQKIYSIFLLVFIYVIPGVLMTAMYTAMGRKLWQSGQSMRRQASKATMSTRVISERRRVARMSVLVAVIFTLCWLPYYIISTLMDLGITHNNIQLGVLFYSMLLGHSNCAVNPLLYCFIGKRFRVQLMHTIKNGCCKPSTIQNQSSFLHGRYNSKKALHHRDSWDSRHSQNKQIESKKKYQKEPLLLTNHVANGSVNHSEITVELNSHSSLPMSPQDNHVDCKPSTNNDDHLIV